MEMRVAFFLFQYISLQRELKAASLCQNVELDIIVGQRVAPLRELYFPYLLVGGNHNERGLLSCWAVGEEANALLLQKDQV